MQRTVERMLRTSPEPPLAPADPLSACIHACVDCADLCTTTSRMLSRQLEPDLGLISLTLQLCVTVCDACAYECGRHAAMHVHCDVCAAACRRCMDACRALLGTTVHPHRFHH